ncbi:MAG: PAS domain-containing protein [Candidatus Riflebacteria bacterium]|nr:PAS domain-containing protein [Candidatus Riflebacteria bacterium]
MEKEMKEFLNEKTKELLNSMFDGVYIVDTFRKIVFWNKAAEKITGYKAHDVIGKSCRDNILNHIDENGNLLCVDSCPLQKSMDCACGCQGKVYPMTYSGQRITVSTNIGPIRDDTGKIIGGIEVFRDITSEEKLAIIQEKFQKMIKQYVSDSTFDSVINSVDQKAVFTAGMKDLTVFFMDICNFTTMSEQMIPQDIVKLLNIFFANTSVVIKNNCGDIDKFIGDCIMATFVDAQDAVNVAKTITLTGISELNKSLNSMGLPSIKVRIGINSGNLVQGDIGSETRKDFTVIGDVVNTASRVESAAEQGSFLISESTLARLDKKNEFEFVKEILLKGKTTPIKLFKLKKVYS